MAALFLLNPPGTRRRKTAKRGPGGRFVKTKTKSKTRRKSGARRRSTRPSTRRKPRTTRRGGSTMARTRTRTRRRRSGTSKAARSRAAKLGWSRRRRRNAQGLFARKSLKKARRRTRKPRRVKRVTRYVVSHVPKRRRKRRKATRRRGRRRAARPGSARSIRRSLRRKGRRRNPNGFLGQLTQADTWVSAIQISVGALGAGVLAGWAYNNWAPAAMQTNGARMVGRPISIALAGAVIGWGVSAIGQRKLGKQMALGGIIAAALDVTQQVAQRVGLMGYGDYIQLQGLGTQAQVEAGVFGTQAQVEAGDFGDYIQLQGLGHSADEMAEANTFGPTF